MKVVARLLLFFLLPLLLQTLPLQVQGAKSAKRTEITLASVRKKIDTIKNKANIEEALKQRILDAYYAAEDNLEELLTLEQRIQEIQNQLKNLPDEIKQLEKRIGKTENRLKNKKEEHFSTYPNDELEQRLINEKSNLYELKSSINHLEIQIAELLRQPQQIRERITEINNVKANTLQEQTTLSTQVSDKQELAARQAQLDSRSRKLNATLTKLDLENIVNPLKVQAQKLELQLQNLQSKQLSGLIKGIDDVLIERRQEEIDKAQAELIQEQKEASDKHPVIQTATSENIRYNQLLQKINNKQEQYLNKKSEIERLHKQLEKDFQSAAQKINLAGLSPALGNVLREQRRNLPTIQEYQNIFDSIQEEIALVSLELFELDEVKKSLADMDQAVLSRMSESISADLDEAEKLRIRTELRVLLNDQKDLVLNLNSVYSGYSKTLADVDFSLNQLVTIGEKYSDYLDERLLWVPSAPVINTHYISEIFKSIGWFGNISQWRQLAVDIKNTVQVNPLPALLGFSVVLLPLLFRRKIKTDLHALLEKSSRLYSDRFVYTFYGLGYVFLLTLPLALLMAWLGWIVLINEQAAYFSQSVANGFLSIVIPVFIVQFFYRLFKPKGFVQTLFSWQEHSINLLYGQIKWMRLVIIPTLFIIGMFADEAYSERSYSLGRMALIVLMLIFSYMFHRFAHPVNGLLKDFYQQNPNSWICRLRYIGYGVLVFMPLIIIGFAIAGYYQSALELQQKLVIFLRLTFFTVILHEVVMRWLLLCNRQLALQNARQKRKMQEQEQEQANDQEGAMAAAIPEEDLLLDIPKINEQNQKLLTAIIIAIVLVGSWLTLHDILPAFAIFDEVVLWQHRVMIEGQEVQQPITLVNLFICLLYLVLMLVFVNNFPGFIDVLSVGRYSMAAGSRYALIQLTRYAVITITLIAVANKLGGRWEQVQWLVAAVSVGLGFGMQEIFANMVSGIILLFERPIRVGDTVTVGDISGKVCRIHMRATTIVDWDRKELVVPNKAFITDKLINWTLTETITRVVIPVGISYDSDEELALRILEQVLEETPQVLEDPEPRVYFMGFGDSSLDFSVRAYVSDTNDRLPVIDELHRRIRRAFKENNIEIPFPQRDLHIRSSVLSDGHI